MSKRSHIPASHQFESANVDSGESQSVYDMAITMAHHLLSTHLQQYVRYIQSIQQQRLNETFLQIGQESRSLFGLREVLPVAPCQVQAMSPVTNPEGYEKWSDGLQCVESLY